MEFKDSKLNLEETLIPYPDSFDLKKNNETQYFLRLGKAYQFEKQILLSRSSKSDYDSLEMTTQNLAEIIEWYHSTVFSLQKEILSDDKEILMENNELVSGDLFDVVHKNFEMAKEMLLACDIILLKKGIVYRYLLKENLFLKIYSYDSNEIQKLHSEQAYLDSLQEMICIVVNPKRLAVACGEKSYQKSLILAGQLSFLLQSLVSPIPDNTLKMRVINQFYDFNWLNIIGYEDSDRILSHIFEVHQ